MRATWNQQGDDPLLIYMFGALEAGFTQNASRFVTAQQIETGAARVVVASSRRSSLFSLVGLRLGLSTALCPPTIESFRCTTPEPQPARSENCHFYVRT